MSTCDKGERGEILSSGPIWADRGRADRDCESPLGTFKLNSRAGRRALWRQIVIMTFHISSWRAYLAHDVSARAARKLLIDAPGRADREARFGPVWWKARRAEVGALARAMTNCVNYRRAHPARSGAQTRVCGLMQIYRLALDSPSWPARRASGKCRARPKY